MPPTTSHVVADGLAQNPPVAAVPGATGPYAQPLQAASLPDKLGVSLDRVRGLFDYGDNKQVAIFLGDDGRYAAKLSTDGGNSFNSADPSTLRDLARMGRPKEMTQDFVTPAEKMKLSSSIGKTLATVPKDRPVVSAYASDTAVVVFAGEAGSTTAYYAPRPGEPLEALEGQVATAVGTPYIVDGRLAAQGISVTLENAIELASVATTLGLRRLTGPAAIVKDEGSPLGRTEPLVVLPGFGVNLDPTGDTSQFSATHRDGVRNDVMRGNQPVAPEEVELLSRLRRFSALTAP
ncbi:MAG: hypothetical protein ACKVPX_16435 [Myxococcaceae bacterium]